MNARPPRYSVLMPTHNRADVLGFAILSVLAQTEPDFELLVVADGCTDGTRDVVTSFSDSRIRFFDLPKVPHFGYANRNVALREARGRLIAFAPHDDLLLPDHLALMGELLDQNKASWGYSRPLWVSTDGVIVPFCTNLGNADEMNFFLTKANTIPAACVVHTRAALEQAGFWPEDAEVAGDWILWRRMLANPHHTGAYLNQPTSLHFSAKWKQSRHSASALAQAILNIADNDPCWPAILRHAPSGGEPEQATLWRAIKTGGSAWVMALRMAATGVIDRIAWTAIWAHLANRDARGAPESAGTEGNFSGVKSS